MVLRMEDNLSPYLTMVETAEPTAPDAGQQRLYVDPVTHLFMIVDSTGAQSAIGGLADPMTTRGDIIVRNASNATARLAKGSADTYLGSDGTDVTYSAVTDAKLSTSDITTNNASTSKHGFLKKLDNSAAHYMDGTGAWSTPSGGSAGALVFLEAHTASSSASLDFTTFISSTYDVYKVIGTDIAPATNGAALWCRVGTGGGPTYDSGGNYESGSAMGGNGGAGTTLATSGGTAGVIITNIANNAGYGFGAFEWTFHNLQSTAHRKVAFGTNAMTTSAPLLQWGSAGFQWVTNGTAVTALQFLMSSGNIASGTIRIYGIAKS